MTSTPGIRNFGVYLPRLRLERAAIAAATGWATGARAGKARGARACCNWDEDSVTMAVEAARDCLGDGDRSGVRWLALASTTLPFADRSNGGLVATALDLAESVSTLDVTSCQRAGVSALLLAFEHVAGGDGDALVVAADRRLAKPGSEQEMNHGHGAAAFRLGRGPDVAAVRLGQASMLADFVDHYRASGADFDYALEERWVRDEGYLKVLPRTVATALASASVAATEVRHFVAQGPKRFAAAAAKAAGIAADAVVDDLHANCGDTGAAHPLLMLAGALERAAAGEVIVVAGFGQGCDVIVLRATGAATRSGRPSGLAAALARGLADREYVRFLSNSGLVEMEWGMRAERDARTAQSVAWRRHRELTAFVGGRCPACGTAQFPKTRACVNPDCRVLGELEDHPLAETTGRVKTYTEDWLAYTRSPPLVYGNVAIEPGGNVFIEFTDTASGELAVGAPVRFVFRVKDFDRVRGFHRYWWKATPVRT